LAHIGTTENDLYTCHYCAPQHHEDAYPNLRTTNKGKNISVKKKIKKKDGRSEKEYT
jgi:hypothetical protein